MPNGAWKGESISSLTFSPNLRDSRVVSIYEKYLYDPKDLESSDPRRRELARKASQLKLHGQPANNMEANGMRALPQQRKSIAFSQGTKPADGRTAAGGMRSQNTTISASRDSGAFGLGLGMLGGGDSDSDSDSEDQPRRSKVASPGLDRLQKTSSPNRPESWTDRAAAVGQRPPDSASQNPPSLKLMSLKSANQGGDIPTPRSHLTAQAEPVDRTSRHGSTIGFARPPSQSDKHISARIALTKQLGLVTPIPPPTRQDNAAQGYFDSQFPRAATGGPSPPRQIALPPPIDVRRAQAQPASFAHSPNGQPFPSPLGSAQSYGSSPNSATPLRPTGHGPSTGVTMPPNVLQRGPPPSYELPMPSPSHPAALRSGDGSAPLGSMPPPSLGRGPPPPRGPPPSRGPPPPAGFSNVSGQQQRQSLFRRSMALLSGGQSMPAPGQSNGGPGNGFRSGPQTRPGPPVQRRSFFRRSMALLGSPQTNRMGPPPPPVDPLPRVQGLQDDYEKPDHPRKSQYLGAGGAGAEWDTQGEGAKFWRRFSVAQKREHMPKLEEGSKAWLTSSANGRRKLYVWSTLALIILVGVIVGAIVWREIVDPSGKVSDEPSSIYKANLAAKFNSTIASTTLNSDKAALTSIATTSNSRRRSVSRRSPAQEIINGVHQHSDMIIDINHTGKRSHRLRKRHFGQPVPLSFSPSSQTVD